MPLSLGLRPRLDFEVSGRSEELARRIREEASEFSVTQAGSYLVIKIPAARQHYWSPQVQIELEDREAGQVKVRGLVTPMPAVWSLFAGCYALISVLGFFGTLYGLAQRQLGQSGWAGWSFPVALGLIACVYAAARIGQRLGQAQREELTGWLHTCLKPSP